MFSPDMCSAVNLPSMVLVPLQKTNIVIFKIYKLIGYENNMLLFQDPHYLYDVTNETAGRFVPAQILYDAFYGRYQSGTGAIILLIIMWASFFFAGLSITTSAARVVSCFLTSSLFIARITT